MAVRAYALWQNLCLSLRPSRHGGQGMVEYALILALLSIVVIVVLVTMGAQVHNVFVNVAKALGVRCDIGHCT